MAVVAAAFLLIAIADKYGGPVAGTIVALAVVVGAVWLWLRLRQASR